jgi:hypothetical protein
MTPMCQLRTREASRPGEGTTSGDHDRWQPYSTLYAISQHRVRSRRRTQAMKAVVYSRYGSPDVLQFTDVEKPTPRTTRCWSRCRRYPSTVRLGGAAGETAVRPDHGPAPSTPPHPRVGHRRTGRGDGSHHDEIPARRRRVRRHPQLHGQVRRVRVRARERTGTNAGRDDLRGSRGPPQAGAIALQGIWDKGRSSLGRRC